MGTAADAAARRVFVGRQYELDVLTGALDAARRSLPQIVWLEGEAGIGKTACLRRFLADAGDVVVLEASGEESETTLDYGVLQQLVARAGRADPGWAQLSEHIGQQTPPSPLSVGAELLAMLGSLQDRAPVVIALDDVHWIDASSAGALLFALRRLHGDRVLVLVVSRPGELEHLGPSWARLLDDSERVHRVRLSGLSGLEVGMLAASLGVGELSLSASERLRAHTGAILCTSRRSWPSLHRTG